MKPIKTYLKTLPNICRCLEQFELVRVVEPLAKFPEAEGAVLVFVHLQPQRVLLHRGKVVQATDLRLLFQVTANERQSSHIGRYTISRVNRPS